MNSGTRIRPKRSPAFPSWILLCVALPGVALADVSTEQFDLVCTTTSDRVEGTLADGSPVVASEAGEERRFVFDLVGMRFAAGGRTSSLRRGEGSILLLSDPDEIRSFGGVVHMRSDWRLDLDSGQAIRRNQFFSDATGSTVTGSSEWHLACRRDAYSGLPAG